MFRLVCCGGIGDSLQNLSLFPHEYLHRKFGYRSEVVFMQFPVVEAASADGPVLAHAEPPNLAFFEDLINRCPSLRWCGQVEIKKTVGIALNRLLREALKATNRGEVPYFPFHPDLSEGELAALPVRGSGPLIGIQTHLSGLKTKKWGVSNWTAFLKLLLAARPDLQIVLFDSAAAVGELAIDPRISTTLSFKIAQSIRLIPRLDLLVSIESWTKYIAKAHRIPQVVVVPDPRSEYPNSTAERFRTKHFLGLCDDPDISLIGYQPALGALTLSQLTDLKPEDLVRHVVQKLDRHGRAGGLVAEISLRGAE